MKHMRDLLKPYLRFRVHFTFKNGKASHFYGTEWTCTPNQVIWRRVPFIELNREAGYIDCLEMVAKWHGRWNKAKIFSGQYPEFNKLHRKYEGGSLEPVEIQDPVFTDNNRIKKLLYTVEDRIIQIQQVPKEDFSQLVSEQLK